MKSTNHEKTSKSPSGNLNSDSCMKSPREEKPGLCLVCDFSPQSLIGGIEKTINETLPRLSTKCKINVVTTGNTGKSPPYDVKFNFVCRNFGANMLSKLVTCVRFFFKIIEVYRKDRFQIIHAHSNQSGFPAFLASRFLNSKFVLTIHFAWPFCYKGTLLLDDAPCKFRCNTNYVRNIVHCLKCCSKRTNPLVVLWSLASYIVDQVMIRKADAIICLTPESRNRLLETGANKDKLHVVPNPIHVKNVKKEEAKKFREELGLTNDDKLILFSGRIRYEKGLDVLINSIANLEDFVHLVILGNKDGKYFEDLQKLTYQLKLQERVHFTGFLPAHSLHLAYKTCDLFVHPSRWYEMVGSTLLEALKFRKPIIVSGSGGPEWIADNQRGIHVEPNDVSQLTTAIKKCLSDAEYAAKISTNGFNFAKGFTEKLHVSKIMDVYSKI
jgi:glycosyltransferase involved in cell wall biosynthesis